MDYRDEVFMAVAENLSFSKAARELFISQPAVTNHIKELENRLNITLFERKGNRIYLTKAGKLTYDHLKPIRDLYQELEFNLERLNDTFKGALKIGASSTIAQYVIPRAIGAFNKRYPKIEIYLLNGNSLEMEQKLLDNEIDMALVENEESNSDIKYFDFMEDEIIAVTGGNSIFTRQKSISLTDFLQIPIVLREKGSGTLQVIRNALAKNNIKIEDLNISIHLGSTESIKNFLSDFDGIALISEKAIEKELRLKELKQIIIKNLNLQRQFRLAFRQGHQSSVTQLFIHHLNHYNF